MAQTSIEWADASWNSVTGCTKTSEGCQHCYAERMARRLAGRYGYPKLYRPGPDNTVIWDGDPFKVTFHPDRLEEPLKWKKPRKTFICSMSDLFHPDVKDEWRHQILDITHKAPQHIYIVLTKRPEIMQGYFHNARIWGSDGTIMTVQDKHFPVIRWDRLCLGISIENQKRAEERLPYLLNTPALTRLISYEPALGPIDIKKILHAYGTAENISFAFNTRIHWIICGGESGQGARPMSPEWARGVRDFCRDANIPFFFKQWGAWAPVEGWPADVTMVEMDGHEMGRGRNWRTKYDPLDGEYIRQWPARFEMNDERAI